MEIGFIAKQEDTNHDLIIHKVAMALIERGYRAFGTVQTNTEREDGGPCNMDVVVLPDGPKVRISQNLGLYSKGCRLDPGALEEAVAGVDASLDDGVDCLIVNKFGKHEAEGRGFRPIIARAVADGIPVLVGLNDLNREAFLEFVGEDAVELKPDVQDILNWLEARMGSS